jgi:peptidoglycan/LPS O-acetylase OafA/YrhL
MIMPIPIPFAVEQTQLFVAVLALLIFVSCRRVVPISFSKETTMELKGFAILAVIFAHIGYYLAEDTRFLFPLSISAGVGVNLFLFLSGYGLTHSTIRRPPSVWEFYKKRLGKLYIPLWIALAIFLVFDRLFLGKSYSLTTIWQSIIGFFPEANLYTNIDSPLWYFTLIIFYYMVYPLVFTRRAPIISALLLAIIGYGITTLVSLPVDEGVLGAYTVHLLAFPLGIACAALWQGETSRLQRMTQRLKEFFERPGVLNYAVRAVCLVILASLFIHLSLHADIGEGPWIEQRTSLITMFILIGFFLLFPLKSRFLFWTGTFSYEIYLLHWPIVYRYGFLYQWMPAWIATLLYLFLFLGAGLVFQRLVNTMNRKIA